MILFHVETLDFDQPDLRSRAWLPVLSLRRAGLAARVVAGDVSSDVIGAGKVHHSHRRRQRACAQRRAEGSGCASSNHSGHRLRRHPEGIARRSAAAAAGRDRCAGRRRDGKQRGLGAPCRRGSGREGRAGRAGPDRHRRWSIRGVARRSGRDGAGGGQVDRCRGARRKSQSCGTAGAPARDASASCGSAPAGDRTTKAAWRSCCWRPATLWTWRRRSRSSSMSSDVRRAPPGASSSSCRFRSHSVGMRRGGCGSVCARPISACFPRVATSRAGRARSGVHAWRPRSAFRWWRRRPPLRCCRRCARLWTERPPRSGPEQDAQSVTAAWRQAIEAAQAAVAQRPAGGIAVRRGEQAARSAAAPAVPGHRPHCSGRGEGQRLSGYRGSHRHPVQDRNSGIAALAAALRQRRAGRVLARSGSARPSHCA